jgi:hypothetical protein
MKRLRFLLSSSGSYWGRLVFAGLLVACHPQPDNDEHKGQPSAPVAGKPKSISEPPALPMHAVEDLLPIHGDTLLAAMQSRLALTTDGGRHWRDLPRSRSMPLIKRLAMDQHHTLWGLDWWPGVHEAPYSRLSYSTDLGESWAKHHEFDPGTFFPSEFYSLPGHPIQMVTHGEDKLYQMQDRFGKEWAFIRSLAERERQQPLIEPTLPPVVHVAQDTIPPATYFAARRFKFLKTGHLFARTPKGWQLAARVDMLNELDDVCPCQGSIYVTGRNWEVDQTLYLVQVANGRVQDSIRTNEEYLGLRCDSNGRLWLFGSNGVWQKRGRVLQKLY